MVISFPLYLFDGDQNGKYLVVTRNLKDVKEIPDELLQKYKLGRYRWRRKTNFYQQLNFRIYLS